MVVVDLLVALVVGLLLTFVLVGWLGYDRGGAHRGWGSLLLFLVLFLLIWAGGIWLAPVERAWWGPHWIGFLLVGVMVALLLAAFSPARPHAVRSMTAEQAGEEEATATVFGVFFWVLLIALVAAIVARYAWTWDAW